MRRRGGWRNPVVLQPSGVLISLYARNITGTVFGLVRRAGLVPPSASARDAGCRGGRGERPAHRADRRGQDASRLPAQPGRPGTRPSPGPAHAVCQPAEGAGDRHRAEPDAAGPRDGAGHHHRGPHRRHACEPARSAEGRSAASAADDAGKSRRPVVHGRCAGLLRHPVLHRHGRGARTGGHQARRPACPGRGPSAHPRPDGAPGRPVRHCRPSGCDPGLHRRHTADRGRRRGAAGDYDDLAGGAPVLVGPYGSGSRPQGHGADPGRRDNDRLRQYQGAGGADVPGVMEAERHDAADRAASRLAGSGAAAQGRGRHGRGHAARGGRDVVAGSGHRLGAASIR